MDFKGKTAFVTGAAQGIGKAIVLVLAKYGANIIAADINYDGVKQTIKEVEDLGLKGLAVELDVRNSAKVKNAFDYAIAQMGSIDILVNAAGIAIETTVRNMPEETWDQIMGINAKGVFLCCKQVTEHMINRGSGKIINISSQTAKIGEYANSAYSCSKAAVSMFTQVLALELAEYGINVNAVCPGWVATEMNIQAVIRQSKTRGIEPDEYRMMCLDKIPLKRAAEPEEVGEVVAFLASEKADYITGISYTMAGGSLMI